MSKLGWRAAALIAMHAIIRTHEATRIGFPRYLSLLAVFAQLTCRMWSSKFGVRQICRMQKNASQIPD